MPCDQHTFIDDYIDVLSEISHYCLSHNVQSFLIGGDMNTDISRINSANTITLKHFISNECLQLAILSNMSSVTHTFISALNTQSLIQGRSLRGGKGGNCPPWDSQFYMQI